MNIDEKLRLILSKISNKIDSGEIYIYKFSDYHIQLVIRTHRSIDFSISNINRIAPILENVLYKYELDNFNHFLEQKIIESL